MLYSGEIPFDLQPVARLLCRPEFVSNNGNARSPGEWNLEHVTHAFDAASGFVVQAFNTPPKHRWVGNDGRLHAGKIQVQAKFERAVAFGFTVKPSNLLSHQTKLRWILQFDRSRNRLLRCRFSQFSIRG